MPTFSIRTRYHRLCPPTAPIEYQTISLLSVQTVKSSNRRSIQPLPSSSPSPQTALEYDFGHSHDWRLPMIQTAISADSQVYGTSAPAQKTLGLLISCRAKRPYKHSQGQRASVLGDSKIRGLSGAEAAEKELDVSQHRSFKIVLLSHSLSTLN